MILHQIRRYITGRGYRILRAEKAIAHLCASSNSLIRFGDGETKILRGRGIGFQPANEELRARMAAIIAAHRAGALSGVDFALPGDSLQTPLWDHLRNRRWRRTRAFWARMARRDCLYLDAFLFREHAPEAEKAIKILSEKADWVILVGSRPEAVAFFDHAALCHIAIPARSAFDDYPEIRSQIIDQAEKFSREYGASGLIFLCAGPTAKLLAADLASRWRSLDLGHFFEALGSPDQRLHNTLWRPRASWCPPRES